jgi:hypothetical protein
MGRGGLPRTVSRNAGWATAWQPSPAGQPSCAACCSARVGAVTTRRPRVGRRGGMLTGGSVVAQRRQGVVGDLEGVTGKVPGKEERAGAHRNGGSTVKRRKQRRAAAFVDGEGAPVGGDGGCGVLQHRCERGKLRLAPIWKWCSSEGAHRRGADGGNARTESSAEGEAPAAESRRSGRLGDGDACSALGHGRARQTARRGRKDRPAAGGSALRGAARRGPGGWTLRGGRAEERGGGPGRGAGSATACRRRSSGSATAYAGGALSRDSGGRRGQRDAVDVADRWAGARRGPDRQRLGAAR